MTQEFGSWNHNRKTLSEIVGPFATYEDYAKVQELFRVEYNIDYLHNTEFTRPLPCKVIKYAN